MKMKMKIQIIFLILLVSSCSATWHYNRSQKKGMIIYSPKTKETIKETIPEKITINGRDTIVYTVTEKEYIKDTVYLPKTKKELKYDYKKEKQRLSFIEDSLKALYSFREDSLKFMVKKSVKNDRSAHKSKKKGVFGRFIDKIKNWSLLILIIIVILFYLKYKFL